MSERGLEPPRSIRALGPQTGTTDLSLVLSPFVSQDRGLRTPKETKDSLVVLKELLKAGKVTPVIDRTYPLSEVAEAIRDLEEGHASGKIVITV